MPTFLGPNPSEPWTSWNIRDGGTKGLCTLSYLLFQLLREKILHLHDASLLLEPVLPCTPQRSQGTSSKNAVLYIFPYSSTTPFLKKKKKKINTSMLILVQTSQQQHMVSCCWGLRSLLEKGYRQGNEEGSPILGGQEQSWLPHGRECGGGSLARP